MRNSGTTSQWRVIGSVEAREIERRRVKPEDGGHEDGCTNRQIVRHKANNFILCFKGVSSESITNVLFCPRLRTNKSDFSEYLLLLLASS